MFDIVVGADGGWIFDLVVGADADGWRFDIFVGADADVVGCWILFVWLPVGRALVARLCWGHVL